MITNEKAPSVNGIGSYSLSSDDRRNWRDQCLEFSLQGFFCEEYDDALLAAVRRHQPELKTLFVEGDRVQLLAFMRETLSDFRPLCTPTESYSRDIVDRFNPYAGWWSASFQGQTVEVVLPPYWYENGNALLLGDDAAMLRRFAVAAMDHADLTRGRTLLYATGWKKSPQIDAEIGKITWDDLVLPSDQLQQIRATVEGWASGKETYEAMGFSWRRGILLVGPPGTGKTMIGKAIAAALPQLPFLFVRDFRERDRDAFVTIFQRARKLAPCILLIEDIDTLINDSNRTILLNEIDGLKSNSGILTIASTNHPHKIDEAFLKRPSRFDRIFHIGLPAEAERAEFCRRVLTRSAFAARLSPTLDTEALIHRVVERSKGFTPAYLKEALTGAALSLAHSGYTDLLDERYADAVLAQVDELKATMRKLKDPAALAEITTADSGIGLRRHSDD